MSDPRIRPAAVGDIAAITRIYADAVREGTATFEIEPPDEAEMARRHQALLADNLPYLVVEHTGAVAGYSYAGRYHARPGYRWTLVDGLITNFHLPKSTLLMMVSALAGSDLITAAYHAAVGQRYRFFSFGDAMLILPPSDCANLR